MSLNTNSWDFIYTAYLGSAGKALRKDVLFKDTTINYTNTFELKIVSTTVDFVLNSTDDDTKITLKVTCTGTYKTYNAGAWSAESSFTGMELKFGGLLLDYVNKPDVAYVNDDFTCDVTGMPSGIIKNDLVHYFHSFTASTTSLVTNPLVGVPLTKMPFHSYFSELAFFTGQTWMKPALLRIGRQTNKFDTENPQRIYISFCYMLSRKENDVEKAYNNNPAYVDFNAIPIKATSALVIERSVFGEYMVKAAFGTVGKDNIDTDIDINVPDPNDPNKTKKAKKKANTFDGKLFKGLEADGDLVKAGTYAFSNNKKIELKSTDYKNEYGTPVGGKVEAERLLLSIEESNIKLSMGDVGYTYGGDNKPTINQEYVFDLKWDATAKKLVASGKEKLFIISNDFKRDDKVEFWFNLMTPIVKNLIVEPLLAYVHQDKTPITNFMMIKKEKTKTNAVNNVTDSRYRSLTDANLSSNGIQLSNLSGQSGNENSVSQGLLGQDANQFDNRVEASVINNSDNHQSSVNIVKRNKNTHHKIYSGFSLKGPLVPRRVNTKTLEKGYLYYLLKKNELLKKKCENMHNVLLSLEENRIKNSSSHLDFKADIALFKGYISFLERNQNFNKENITKDSFKILNHYQAEVGNGYLTDFKSGDNDKYKESCYFFVRNNPILEKIKSRLDNADSKNFDALKEKLDTIYNVKDNTLTFSSIIGDYNRLKNHVEGDEIQLFWKDK